MIQVDDLKAIWAGLNETLQPLSSSFNEYQVSNGSLNASQLLQMASTVICQSDTVAAMVSSPEETYFAKVETIKQNFQSGVGNGVNDSTSDSSYVYDTSTCKILVLLKAYLVNII